MSSQAAEGIASDDGWAQSLDFRLEILGGLADGFVVIGPLPVKQGGMQQ